MLLDKIIPILICYSSLFTIFPNGLQYAFSIDIAIFSLQPHTLLCICSDLMFFFFCGPRHSKLLSVSEATKPCLQTAASSNSSLSVELGLLWNFQGSEDIVAEDEELAEVVVVVRMVHQVVLSAHSNTRSSIYILFIHTNTCMVNYLKHTLARSLPRWHRGCS